MDIKDEQSVAFVSMSGRDSAMWFSFTGLYHALKDTGVSCEFYFPSTVPDTETTYCNNVFYYRLKTPLKTFSSVFKLAKTINKSHKRVVIFSQGIFSALLVFLLRKDIDVIAWSHEIDNYVSRSGLLRGLNYFLSDRYMGRRTSKVIVGSDDLYKKAGLLYPKKIIINSCLPLSGDFYEQLAINGTPNTNDSLGVISFDKQAPIRILFFGGITAYKGLHYLNDVISTLPAGYINVRIIGRGDLKKVAPDLYARSLNEKDVTWINRFASAEEVISELKNSDMMFAMYDSVTATSLIDIANSLGVPVLTSELPFFKSKIKDGVNGFIINRNELHEFLNSKIKDKTINKDLVFKYFRTCGVNNQCANSLIANDVVRRMK